MSTERKGPVPRFTILDATRVRAGPTAVRTFADLGARVFQLENPPAAPGGDGMIEVPQLIDESGFGSGPERVKNRLRVDAAVGAGFKTRTTASMQFSRHPRNEGPIKAAPYQGDQTDSILTGLGYSTEQIAQLRT